MDQIAPSTPVNAANAATAASAVTNQNLAQKTDSHHGVNFHRESHEDANTSSERAPNQPHHDIVSMEATVTEHQFLKKRTANEARMSQKVDEQSDRTVSDQSQAQNDSDL